MEFLLGDILLAGVGWLYLVIRYRKKEVIAKVLADKYEGSYSKAGSSMSLSTVAILFGLVLTAFIVAILFVYLKNVLQV